jgi:sugar phosphate permease
VPRVFLYSATFFFTKFAVYSILLQLPTFLSSLGYDNQEIANISTTFDSGAIAGSIILGYSSDVLYSKRSPIGMIAVLVSMAISYSLTFRYIEMSMVSFYFAMFFFGFFESGL